MYSVNVRSAEGGRGLRIVMSHMKRYLCLNESLPSRGHE